MTEHDTSALRLAVEVLFACAPTDAVREESRDLREAGPVEASAADLLDALIAEHERAGREADEDDC